MAGFGGTPSKPKTTTPFVPPTYPIPYSPITGPQSAASLLVKREGGRAIVSPSGEITYDTGGYPAGRTSFATGDGTARVQGGASVRTETDPLAAMRESARLQAEAEQRRLGYLSALPQGGATAPTVSYGDAGAEAARAAAFARAKDRAGQIARASIAGLQNVLGSRGISGSGIEALGTAGILGAAGSELGEVNREQLIQDLARQQHIQDLIYQGNITQRGQTLAAQNPQTQALLGLITARGLY